VSGRAGYPGNCAERDARVCRCRQLYAGARALQQRGGSGSPVQLLLVEPTMFMLQLITMLAGVLKVTVAALTAGMSTHLGA
jgi:hypothetical protein